MDRLARRNRGKSRRGKELRKWGEKRRGREVGAKEIEKVWEMYNGSLEWIVHTKDINYFACCDCICEGDGNAKGSMQEALV
jgi:hypothetical protein